MADEMILGEDSGLLLIDVQKGFDELAWGSRNNPMAEEQITKLLAAFRAVHLPIYHVQHASASVSGLFRKGSDGFLHKDSAKPLESEPIYIKSVNSAFIGTSLERDLRTRGIKTLIIVGLTTNHCVSTTARMSGNLGFHTLVVQDATACFERRNLDGQLQSAEEVHTSALSDLNGEFATIVSTEDVLTNIPLEIDKKNNNVNRSETHPIEQKLPSPEAKAYIDRITGYLQNKHPLTVLQSSVDVIGRYLAHSAAEELLKRPDPQKWSVAEILAHLADTEVVLSFRFRQILSANGIEIPAYDQDRWALVSDYQSILSSVSLERLSINRQANLGLMRTLTPDQMLMYGVHAERGVETVGHLLRMWAGHDLNHIHQIEKLLQSPYASDGGAN